MPKAIERIAVDASRYAQRLFLAILILSLIALGFALKARGEPQARLSAEDQVQDERIRQLSEHVNNTDRNVDENVRRISRVSDLLQANAVAIATQQAENRIWFSVLSALISSGGVITFTQARALALGAQRKREQDRRNNQGGMTA